jgi:hypothetical protein
MSEPRSATLEEKRISSTHFPRHTAAARIHFDYISGTPLEALMLTDAAAVFRTIGPDLGQIASIAA